MLNEQEARTMEEWAGRATAWAESSHAFIDASTELATSSRRLADDLVAAGGSPPSAAERDDLAKSLFELAGVVEEGARAQSEGYLGTAASLEQLRSLPG
jgi:hypothetical protein